MPVARALMLGGGQHDVNVTRLAPRFVALMLLACGIALLSVSPARALFGDSVTISVENVHASQPRIATDGANNALAVWTEGASGARRVSAAFRPAGGDFAPLGFLSAEGGDADRPQVVFDERGNALVVWTQFHGGLGNVQAAFRPAGGSFGVAQTISAGEPGVSYFEPQVGIDESATAVWTRESPAGALTVQAAFRPKGGGFGAPQTLSAIGQAFEPHVAVDERGDSLAVWTEEVADAPVVFSAFRARTRDWSAPTRVSPADLDASQPQVAIDARNNAIAVWTADADGANPADSTFIQAAPRPAGGGFGTAETISNQSGPASEPRVVFDERGNALAAWSRFDGQNTRVEASFRDSKGGFDVAQTLSPAGSDAFEPRIAVDESAAVMWTRSDGLNLRVQGAFRRKAGTFGAAQTLSDPDQDAFEPDVAVDEHGNALAVWTRNEGLDVPRVQFSFRPRVGSYAEPAALSVPGAGAFEPQVATDRWNNALAVWTMDPDVSDPSNPTWIEAAFASAGQPFGPPERLSDPGANAFQPRIAFERDGDAVVAWTGEDGDGTQRVQASFRPARAGFLDPVDLSPDGGDAFDPQVSAGRGAVVVWSRHDGTNLNAQASMKPDNVGFLPAETLSAAGEDANSPHVAVGENGTVVATWFVGAGERVDAAVGSSASATFQPAAALSAPTTNASEPQVAVDQRGNTLVVWTAGNGTTHVQAAYRPAGGPFRASADVSDVGASEPQVVFDERGNALAVWTRFVAGLGQIEAAFRPAGATFAAAEPISHAGGVETLNNFGPRVAIDESAAVVWTAQTPAGFLRLQSAFRPATGGFGAVQTLSDRRLFAYQPHVAVDERGNAYAVWTLADLTDPNIPPTFSTIEAAFRPRI